MPVLTKVSSIPEVGAYSLNEQPTQQKNERLGLAKASVNHRREIFCQRFVIHGNAPRAAMEAGYGVGSEHDKNVHHKTLRTVSGRLLNDPDVEERIKEIRLEAQVKNDIDLDYVISNLIAEAEDFDKNKGAERIKALELITKLLGMSIDRLEISGSVDIVPRLEDVIEAKRRLSSFQSQQAIEVGPAEPISSGEEKESISEGKAEEGGGA